MSAPRTYQADVARSGENANREVFPVLKAVPDPATISPTNEDGHPRERMAVGQPRKAACMPDDTPLGAPGQPEPADVVKNLAERLVDWERGGYALRRPCPCGSLEGRVETVNGQDVVRCLVCDRYQYNAPKTETGREVRTLSTTHDLVNTKQRFRILARAGTRCEICGAGRAQGRIDVGHIISVKDGHDAGLTDQEINSDDNLIAQCGQCNSGQGSASMPWWLAYVLLRKRGGAGE